MSKFEERISLNSQYSRCKMLQKHKRGDLLGKSDVILKQWLKNKERFADLFNAVIFDGEQVIKPEELEELNSESGIVIASAIGENDTEEKNDRNVEYSTEEEKNRDEKQRKNKVYHRTEQRYRDMVMRWKGEAELAVLALENQGTIHYAMPVRGMLYDALAYTDQMRLLWNQLSDEEKKCVNENEFFSRFRKQDSLCPVITIVFYYGEEPWDGATELYELFGVKDRELIHIIQKYVSNYRMNLIEVNGEEDVTKFKSDLQIMFSMLKYRKDKRRLIEYTKEHKDSLDKLDYESVQAMAVLLKTPQLLAKMNEKEGAEGNMCQALEEYYQDGVQEGIEKGIAQGIQQGIEQGMEKGIEQERKNIIANMLRKGFDVELIAELAGLPVCDVRRMCSEI